jgi:cell division protein FtsI (penicillin-binding protein 3)
MEQSTPRIRQWLFAGLLLVWMAAVVGRLGYLQLFRYTEYLAKAQKQQQRFVEISPKRGVIYDRNHRELAMSVQADSLFAVPSEIADPGMVSRLVAGVLECEPGEIETKLKSSRSFVWIARKLPPEKAERIRAMNLRGIYFQRENRRIYPKRELAAHVLGFVDIDERGLAGIELEFDSIVRPRPGRLLILADARRRWYERSEQAADTGASVVLTIDEKIQYIIEKELAAAIAETRAAAGMIVVQDPATGEILGMANWPTFNPNQPGESEPEARRNRAVAALYEPGSIFKVVAVAAAIEEGLTTPDEVIDCQMGAIWISGHRIRDHKPFGLLTVTQVIAKSSDVGTIKLGLRLGAPRMYEYIRGFGFGRPTGIELPGETHGLLRSVEKWTPGSIGSISMGQEIGVSAVQMVSAFSAIANGGLLYPPRVVKELRFGTRVEPRKRAPPTRVVSAQTAAMMRKMFESVVLEGTGSLARLDGYTSAGKTGTAQKIDPRTGTYSPTEHIASYVGFAPLNSPAVTILVSLDSPTGLYHGGDVAAPVFKRVAEQVLAYLDVPRDITLPPEKLSPQHRAAATAAVDVSDFVPEQAQPRTEASALPLFPPEPVAGAQTLALEEGEGVAVPHLAGKTVRAVTEACIRLGLNPVLIGRGLAVEQNPPAGTKVKQGSRITVRLGRPQGRASGSAAGWVGSR